MLIFIIQSLICKHICFCTNKSLLYAILNKGWNWIEIQDWSKKEIQGNQELKLNPLKLNKYVNKEKFEGSKVT